LRERGRNLFLELANGNYCELFEGYGEDAVTGCVFFEVALLVYRSAPAQFDDYFRTRFGLDRGIHERACAILDGPETHDAKMIRLEDFYSTFAEVTDPHVVDPAMARLVTMVIANMGDGIAHLNVLEDYYESQQDKVRVMIEILQLPMKLVTIHFNAQTGRVVLDD
jgi:hypothetical protein